MLLAFRVREKDRGASYALSLSHQRTTKHYRIDRRKVASGEVYAIEEGPTFENLMDVSTNQMFVNCSRVYFQKCHVLYINVNKLVI